MLPAFWPTATPSARVLPQEAPSRTFWMSMPGEAKHLARMQAVWGFLKSGAAGGRAADAGVRARPLLQCTVLNSC